jgi:hypothetical protein
MRRSAALFGFVCALAACRGEPAAAPQPAKERAPAAPAVAPTPLAPVPNRTGDRHARAAARRSPVVKRIDGRLARSDERTVVVGAPDAPPLTLRIAPGTAVTLDGLPARAEALPAGADVRAAYRTGDEGRPTAISIEARRAREPPRPPPRPPPTPPAPVPEPEERPPATWDGTPHDVPPPD